MVSFYANFSPGNVAVQMPTPTSSTPVGYPFVLIGRVAGADDRIQDFGITDVDVFHTSRDLANAAAWQLHSWTLQWTPQVGVVMPSTGRMVFIDRISTIQGPHWVDYDDENLKRYCMRYEVTSRINSFSV